MKNICILTHLKPVDDTRHFHKLAQSLAKTNKYEINIIGIGSKKINQAKNIQFHTHAGYPPRLLNRFYYPWILIKKCIQLKPDLIVANHPELLPLTVLYKIIFGTKIVYDVQENYKLNLLHQHNYSFPLRQIFAYLIRATESICAGSVDHFFLAEKVYQSQLPFIKTRWTVLENKAIALPQYQPKPRQEVPIKFLFSGNISKNSGADIALEWFSKLDKKIPDICLHVIGHAPQKAFLHYLKNKYQNRPDIILNIHPQPLPYAQIQEAITAADIAILSYRENESNRGKVPTKYFEYNAAQLPYLIHENSLWKNLPSSLRIPVDFQRPDWQTLLLQWRALPTPKEVEVSGYLWDSQVPSLLKAIDQILAK